MAFLLFRPFLSVIWVTFLLLFSKNLFARQIFESKLIVAAEYEAMATNYEDYNKSNVLKLSNGRTRTVEYKGGKKSLAGFFLSYRPDFLKSEKGKIQISFRSTLLLGQKNENDNNLSDQADYDLDGENSFVFNSRFYYKDWIASVEREVFSVGKVKSIDTSSDPTGNTGEILGTYNLRVKRTLVQASKRFGDFPFFMGIKGHRETIPRLPHTYIKIAYAGSGPLQNITYHALSAVLELGEGDFLNDYSESGFKYSLNFTIGIAEYNFQNYTGVEDGESSSTIGAKFNMGWQWNFQMADKYWFLKWDNQFSVNSFDNNDSNASGVLGTIYRTSGSDEEYSLLIRTGIRFK